MEVIPSTLYIGDKCNNDCEMCSIANACSLKGENDFSTIREQLKDIRKSSDSVEITGGEPTVHSDIQKIVRTAQTLGFKNISIGSNGRKFSDRQFTKKLAESGLNHVTLSLHGPEEIHNSITRKECYNEVLNGIKNLKSHGIVITAVTVLMKKNIGKIEDIARILKEKNIERWIITDLLPEGEAEKRLEALSVPYTTKKNVLYQNLDKLRSFDKILFGNFTRCVLPINLPENFYFHSDHMKQEKCDYEGGISNESVETDKKRLALCEECALKDECFGFYDEKVDIHGEKDIKKMIDIDDFTERFSS